MKMENIDQKEILLFASNVIRNHVSAFLFTTASNQQPVFNWRQVKYCNKKNLITCINIEHGYFRRPGIIYNG